MPSLIRKKTWTKTNRKGREVEAFSWQVQFPIGETVAPANGEEGEPAESAPRKVKYLFKSFATKAEAQAFLDEKQAERKTGGVVKPSAQLVKAYLPEWLESAKPRLRANTAASYARIVKNYLVPQLGDLPLQALTPLLINAAYSRLLGSGLSARTVTYSHAVLRRALKSAVKSRLLSTNPAATLVEDLPKKDPTREMRPLTKAEAKALLDAARAIDEEGKPKHRLGVYFELALVTGMRPSELFALRWADLDLKARLVTVKHSLVRTGNTWKITEPKRNRSRRSVPIPEETVAALKAWKVRQAEEKIAAGSAWKGERRFVFTGRTGEPLEIRNLAVRDLVRIARDAGLAAEIPPKPPRRASTWEPVFTLYDLRHTCATILLADGVNPKVVSERLGHASAAFTMDVYCHVTPTMQAEATARYGALLYGS